MITVHYMFKIYLIRILSGVLTYAEKKIIKKTIETPITDLTNLFVDNVIRDSVEPVPGSVLYCDLIPGFADHSGIYVGGGDECIVELSKTNSRSIIQRVTPQEFSSTGTGISIYVSCHNTEAVGNESIACTALDMVGTDIGKYSIAFNNCHMFSEFCLCRGNSKSSSMIGKMINEEMTLEHLKKRAAKILNANDWRVWNYKN